MKFTPVDINSPEIPANMKEVVDRLNILLKVVPDEVAHLLETDRELTEAKADAMDAALPSAMMRGGDPKRPIVFTGLSLLASLVNVEPYRIYAETDEPELKADRSGDVVSSPNTPKYLGFGVFRFSSDDVTPA